MGRGLLMRIRGGGGGGASIPGLGSDGETPGGIVVAGAATVGDQSATVRPSTSLFYGSVQVYDTVGNQTDRDDTFQAYQVVPVTTSNFSAAVAVYRTGDISLHDYQAGALSIYDTSASAAPLIDVEKSNVSIFRVDPDGALIHGKLKTGAAVAHALGAYSGNAVPIYDESGTLLGYMPLYA